MMFVPGMGLDRAAPPSGHSIRLWIHPSAIGSTYNARIAQAETETPENRPEGLPRAEKEKPESRGFKPFCPHPVFALNLLS